MTPSPHLQTGSNGRTLCQVRHLTGTFSFPAVPDPTQHPVAAGSAHLVPSFSQSQAIAVAEVWFFIILLPCAAVSLGSSGDFNWQFWDLGAVTSSQEAHSLELVVCWGWCGRKAKSPCLEICLDRVITIQFHYAAAPFPLPHFSLSF